MTTEDEKRSILYMQSLLPEYTTIAKSPSSIRMINDNNATVDYETIKLRTRDVIHTFMKLQHKAIQKIAEDKRLSNKRYAIDMIKRMRYFK